MLPRIKLLVFQLLKRASISSIIEGLVFSQYEISKLLGSKLAFPLIISIYFVYLLGPLFKNVLSFFVIVVPLSSLYFVTSIFFKKDNGKLSIISWILFFVNIISKYDSAEEAIFLLFYLIFQGKSTKNLNMIITFDQSFTLYFIMAFFNPNQPIWETVIEIIFVIISFNQIFFSLNYQEKTLARKKLRKIEIINIHSISIHSTHSSEQFIASIIHDLRNPISTVHSLLEMIVKDENITLIQKEQLETALFSCDFQLIIINNILDLAKINASKFQLQIKTFSLPKIIKMIVQMESNLAKKKRLKYSAEILNTLPEIVQGDKNRISQIILNLIGNAIKFTEKGCIQIRVSWEKDMKCFDLSNESLHKSIPGSSNYKISTQPLFDFSSASLTNQISNVT